MDKPRVRAVMEAGGLALGCHVSLNDPALVELIAASGYDAAFIDMEHTCYNLETVAELIRVADLCGITSVVRVPSHGPELIGRLLDAGAHAIQVPHIASVAEAEAAVAAVRYPPAGTRGAHGTTRAAQYGATSWPDHVRTSNDHVLLILMIEDQAGVDALDGIAAVDGVDLICVGPADLSSALGLAGDRQTLVDLIEDIAERVRRAGNARLFLPMYHAVLGYGPQELRRLGVGYCTVGPAPTAVLFQALRDTVQQIHADMDRSEVGSSYVGPGSQ
jgi:4-hydroxy-2-oxoheptanedioate aldolase